MVQKLQRENKYKKVLQISRRCCMILPAEVRCNGNIFVMELTREELSLVERCPLFSGIGEEKLEQMFSCLGARRQPFAAGAFPLRMGDQVEESGLVLSGRAQSVMEDGAGKPVVLSLPNPGSLMGVFLAASRERTSPVTIQAKEALEVLFFRGDAITSPCLNNCAEHRLLVRWGCAGRPAWQRRSLACRTAPSVSGCIRPRCILPPRTCSPGLWSSSW